MYKLTFLSLSYPCTSSESLSLICLVFQTPVPPQLLLHKVTAHRLWLTSRKHITQEPLMYLLHPASDSGFPIDAEAWDILSELLGIHSRRIWKQRSQCLEANTLTNEEESWRINYSHFTLPEVNPETHPFMTLEDGSIKWRHELHWMSSSSQLYGPAFVLFFLFILSLGLPFLPYPFFSFLLP